MQCNPLPMKLFLGPGASPYGNTGLGEMVRENDDALVMVIIVGNTPLTVSDPRASWLLPTSMEL